MEAEPLAALVRRAPELPQAPRLASLAVKRGALSLPQLPAEQRFSSRGYPRPRVEPASVTALDPATSALEEQVRELIQEDRSAEAEALVEGARWSLPQPALAQLLTRVGWSWYIVGDNAAAVRLGREAGAMQGEWAAQGDWLAGLAAWRARDCRGAIAGFGRVAAGATDAEMLAAGNYWQARASIACGQPQNATPLFRLAARTEETFYGLLARAALGLPDVAEPKGKALRDAWRHLDEHPNVRVAAALVQLGQEARADALLRWQARLAGAEDYDDLIVLAGALGLPRVQMWLGANVPPGSVVRASARFPAPDWTPDGGWRVNRSLVFAHTLQESNFRHEVRSAADARGLMQVRPIAATDIDRRRGGRPVRGGDLFDPVTNLEYGQSYLEQLRDGGDSQGLLPKVVAAYNAGTVPLARWNAKPDLQGDPLLWIESISYRETARLCPHRAAQLLDVRGRRARRPGQPRGAGAGPVAALSRPARCHRGAPDTGRPRGRAIGGIDGRRDANGELSPGPPADRAARRAPRGLRPGQAGGYSAPVRPAGRSPIAQW